MNHHPPLFDSHNLRLTALDAEKDAGQIASWTEELEIAARLREDQPARPMAAFEVKKIYERWQKESEDKGRQFLFAIRKRESGGADDDRVIGVLRIKQIEWVHGSSFLDLIIGDSADWKRYAREALDLGLRYAFDELSLFRVTAVIAGHDQDAHDLFEQARFTLEVRQRQAVYHNKQAWDKLYFGLLRPEWKVLQMSEVAA